MKDSAKTSFFSWKRAILLMASIAFLLVFFVDSPWAGKDSAGNSSLKPDSGQSEQMIPKADSSGTETSSRFFRLPDLEGILGTIKNFSGF